MTAKVTQNGDTVNIRVSPNLWIMVLSTIIAIAGAVTWIQSSISDRPTRAETQSMIDRSLMEIHSELRHQRQLLEEIKESIKQPYRSER